MTTYRIFSESIVSEAALRSGEVSLATEPVIDDGDPLSLSGEATQFVPIGKGKPLTVMIREVYTGRFPKKGAFRSRKDIAVLSAVKNYDVFAASSRALNFIIEKAQKRTRTRGPNASANGTGVIFYSPAILTDSQLLTIELAVDDFDGEFLETVAGAFETVGKVPLMLPHSGFMMAASEVIKLASGVGEAIFDSRPDVPPFNTSIDFDIPGEEQAKADFRLLAEDGLPAEEYKFIPAQGLIHRETGEKYDGDYAYVVISLDGKKRDNLEAFKPAVASSQIVGRFMSLKSGRDVAIEKLVDGVSLLSDMEYLDRAEKVKKKLSGVQDPDELARLQKELDALVENIRNEKLKP